jgi:hypothetical protein
LPAPGGHERLKLASGEGDNPNPVELPVDQAEPVGQLFDSKLFDEGRQVAGGVRAGKVARKRALVEQDRGGSRSWHGHLGLHHGSLASASREARCC